MTKRLSAEHGVICSMGDERLGFFGWPSVARTDSGKLWVAASGPRYGHVCPFGRTSLFSSEDDGATWSGPRILNDTPIDDRDCGLISLGGERLCLTWFSSDSRRGWVAADIPEDEIKRWNVVKDAITDEAADRWVGSWLRTSVDGGAWSDSYRTPVQSPHGPIRQANGDLLFFGKQWQIPGKLDVGQDRGEIMAARSSDEGKTWELLGSVPRPDYSDVNDFHEPHAIELPSGRLLGLVRYEYGGPEKAYEPFSLFQTESDDGGLTWSEMRPLWMIGSPAHLMMHSSGVIVCSYGYRTLPFGERVMFSHDDGQTWDRDWILDESPVRDLGYPSSVELGDGRIMTVYYQNNVRGTKNADLRYSIWELPV